MPTSFAEFYKRYLFSVKLDYFSGIIFLQTCNYATQKLDYGFKSKYSFLSFA